MSAPDPIPVDPRTISPLICQAQDGLARWPVDTLHRTAITLDLLSDLIGQHGGSADRVFSENQRFALSLQLSGMADVLAAVADGLGAQKITLHPDEIPIKLDREELGKLEILAMRYEASVSAMATSWIRERLETVAFGGMK